VGDCSFVERMRKSRQHTKTSKPYRPNPPPRPCGAKRCCGPLLQPSLRSPPRRRRPRGGRGPPPPPPPPPAFSRGAPTVGPPPARPPGRPDAIGAAQQGAMALECIDERWAGRRRAAYYVAAAATAAAAPGGGGAGATPAVPGGGVWAPGGGLGAVCGEEARILSHPAPQPRSPPTSLPPARPSREHGGSSSSDQSEVITTSTATHPTATNFS
jgi:hypothetical protein